MKKTKLFLFSLIVLAALVFFYFSENRHRSIALRLKQIPQDEYQCLDVFFRTYIDDLGYCLFGNKPMAVFGYRDPLVQVKEVDAMFDRFYFTFGPINLNRYRGWELWKKNQRFFPMKNYAFIKSKNFIDNDYEALVFINKKEFIETVHNHLSDFRKVLGKEITPEGLLEEVLTSKDVFGDVFKHHQGLIGTVLGYGRNNAWLFHRREEMASSNGAISPLLGRPTNFIKKLSKSFSQEELEAFNQILQPFDNRGILDFNPLYLGLPGFVADPNSEETKQLKVRYEQQYRQIIHRYQKGDFLEITLQQMTSD